MGEETRLNPLKQAVKMKKSNPFKRIAFLA